MRPISQLALGVMLAASLATASPSLADDSAPAASQPEPAQAKIGKSRSNIQNNRVAPPAKDDAPATGTEEPEAILKTKTKSNQPND